MQEVQAFPQTPPPFFASVQSGAGINPDPLHHWQQAPTPVLVQNTSSVDVVRAAIGGRHAALITRAGELYTWGCGAGERGGGGGGAVGGDR